MAATRALKPQLYGVYREARQSSSAFSVLCHGQPTLDNILFRYDEAGNPVEAKVGNKGGFDGRGQPTASPMLTAIMSGGVGIRGRELYKYTGCLYKLLPINLV